MTNLKCDKQSFPQNENRGFSVTKEKQSAIDNRKVNDSPEFEYFLIAPIKEGYFVSR